MNLFGLLERPHVLYIFLHNMLAPIFTESSVILDLLPKT